MQSHCVIGVEAMLRIDISKKLGDFSLEMKLETGSGITAVLGRSGAGKSTLAKVLAGLAEPDRGTVVFGGETFFDSARGVSLPPEKRGIGFVFQEHRLFPHLSVRSNLSFGRIAGGRRPRADMERIVELFGIENLLERRPPSLSGGESQRVSLARAILAAENFIIMDEPLCSLDAERRESLLGYIEKIPAAFDIPILYITHSANEAKRLADSILVMDAGRAVYFGASSGAAVPEFVSANS